MINLLSIYNPREGGISNYCERLKEALTSLGYNYTENRINVKNLGHHGYYVTTELGRILKSRKKSEGIRHALAESIAKGADIATVHDFFPLTYKGLFGYSRATTDVYFRVLINRLRKVPNIVVQSAHIYEELQELYGSDVPSQSVTVIPTAVRVPANIGPNPYPSDGKIHVVAVGALNPRKRFDIIYENMQGMKDADLYHVGGRGYQGENERANGHASPNIHPLGYLSNADKFRYIAWADKYAFCSIDEGQGIPTMEAMKLGIQPVINDIPVHRGLLGDLPYYFHSKDEFQEMIRKTPRPKKQLVEQISQYDNFASKYIELYNRLDGSGIEKELEAV